MDYGFGERCHYHLSPQLGCPLIDLKRQSRDNPAKNLYQTCNSRRNDPEVPFFGFTSLATWLESIDPLPDAPSRSD